MATPLEPCWWCKGRGWVYLTDDLADRRKKDCPRCDGTGKIPALVEPPLPGERL